MTMYLKEMCDKVAHWTIKKNKGRTRLWLQALVEEINRLDPRDFLFEAQRDFVFYRVRLRDWLHYVNAPKMVMADKQYKKARSDGNKMKLILDSYAGEGSRAATRQFPFITDNGLKDIVTRDYKELSSILLPGGAWKSGVVLAGSITEAILTDILASDSALLSRANRWSSAPKDSRGRVKDISKGEWKLHQLIEVCTHLNVLPNERADTFDQVLRDYRNFVHPQKEIRAAHACGEPEAVMAKGALDAMCNHLEATRPSSP